MSLGPRDEGLIQNQGDVIFSVYKTKGVSWVAAEGEPIPLKEAYTHDDASTMDRAVATFHI